jgi:hypothetical protein
MSFRNWYHRNYYSITWFIVGWLSFACLDNLLRGNYIWAAIDAGLAYFNYKMSQMQ